MRPKGVASACYLVLSLFAGGCSLLPGVDDPPPSIAYERAGFFHCNVHDSLLLPDVVPIGYGLPPTATQEDADAEMLRFPNASTRSEGGCSFWVGRSPTRELTLFCPDCRSARRRWERSVAQPRPRAGEELFDGRVQSMDEVATVTMQQSDATTIFVGLRTLQQQVFHATTEQERGEALAAYRRVLRKLEEGWPGFTGYVVSVADKTPVRSTPKRTLEHQYDMCAFYPSVLRPPATRPVIDEIKPSDPELVALWEKAKAQSAQWAR
jgi:hypothetical protein